MPSELKPRKSTDIPARKTKSLYPSPFAHQVEGREKRKLGDFFGLKNFGVNLTTLAPGAASALLHEHTVQDEFVYILEGEPTLVTEEGESPLSPNMCIGFPAKGGAHQLVNRSNAPVIYLEIGDRLPGDQADYPRDDLAAVNQDGKWMFTHKDGSPYPASPPEAVDDSKEQP